MRLVRSIDDFRALRRSPALAHRPLALSVGNFDGMHLGHQALFKQMREAVGPEGAQALVTFYPHPRSFFRGERNFQSIVTLRTKIRLGVSFGFDCFYLIHFGRAFSRLTAAAFIEEHLWQGIEPAVVVVGHDWTFGKGREGTPALLEEFGRRLGFRAIVVPAVTVDGRRVSSEALRALLRDGDIAATNRLLGRRFSLSAVVLRGDCRGKALGFPTANLQPLFQLLPKDGVYVTTVSVDGGRFRAVTNIGVRPTFSGTRHLVEAHLLTPEPLDLYGQRIEVEFMSRLRDERRFSTVSELQKAIRGDIAAAEKIRE